MCDNFTCQICCIVAKLGKIQLLCEQLDRGENYGNGRYTYEGTFEETLVRAYSVEWCSMYRNRNKDIGYRK